MTVDLLPLTLAGFLAWEERQEAKFEYRDGAVIAMAGATDDYEQRNTYSPILVSAPSAYTGATATS